MWLFEVHDDVRAGFRLNLRAGEAGVPMGFDETTNGNAWLPLGNSLERALQHPEDQEVAFVLERARLEDKSAGLILTKQTEDEAHAERLALVLVDGCTDPEIGITRIAEAFNKPAPELITFAQGNGHTRRLYVFKPGDGLFISWSARALGTTHPKRFIIAWDGEELKELAVSRPRRNSRPPKRVREEQKVSQSRLKTQELRP